MQVMDIRERVMCMVQRRQKALLAEIEVYRQKLRDTELERGCGGAYNRQQAAIEKREKQLEELGDFEVQLIHMKKHQKVTMYIFGCARCGSITLVNKQPFDDWHECPVCRGMVNLPKLKSKTFQIVDTGEGWMEQLKELAAERG